MLNTFVLSIAAIAFFSASSINALAQTAGKGYRSAVEMAPSKAPLTARFARPPADSRILLILSHWPLDADECKSKALSLRTAGFGGAALALPETNPNPTPQMIDTIIQAYEQFSELGLRLLVISSKTTAIVKSTEITDAEPAAISRKIKSLISDHSDDSIETVPAVILDNMDSAAAADGWKSNCINSLIAGFHTLLALSMPSALTEQQIKEINQFTGRCATILKGGTHSAEIAIVLPNLPQTGVLPFLPISFSVPDDMLKSAADSLIKTQRDFSIISGRELAGAVVKNGIVTTTGDKIRLLIAIDIDKLDIGLLSILEQHWLGGGVVIGVGDLPSTSPKMEIRERIFGAYPAPSARTTKGNGVAVHIPADKTDLISAIVDGLLEADILIEPSESASRIRATHMHTKSKHAYLFFNDSNSTWTGEVTVSAKGESHKLNIDDASIMPLGSRNRLKMHLKPYDAVFIISSAADTSKRLPLSEFKVDGVQVYEANP